jgi:hypothetical protein
MLRAGYRVTITDTVYAVPDHDDRCVLLPPSDLPYEVVDVQEDATLIRLLDVGGPIYAVMDYDRGRLKRVPLHPHELARLSREGRDRAEAEYDAEHGEGAYTRWREAKAKEARTHAEALHLDAFRDEVLGLRRVGRIRHGLIVAALETYASQWAHAVSTARCDGDRADEAYAQGRYDESMAALDELLGPVEGASSREMIERMDANIAAEQMRDRELAQR